MCGYRCRVSSPAAWWRGSYDSIRISDATVRLGAFSSFAIWVVLAAAFLLFFNSKLHPNTVEKLGTGQVVSLVRDISGHYRAEAIINGIKVDVLVDTGATGVSISRELADRLDIESHVAARTHTANGEVVSYMTRLDSVRLGGIEANDVAAFITPSLEGEALLGMSFLSRMDVRLYKGTMTIRSVTD